MEAERTGAGEAMRRKSTARQGEIEMMEGSQLSCKNKTDGDPLTEEGNRSGTNSWRSSVFLTHCAHTVHFAYYIDRKAR